MLVAAVNMHNVQQNLNANHNRNIAKNDNDGSPSFKMDFTNEAASFINNVGLPIAIGIGTLCLAGFVALMLLLRHIGRHW